MTTGANFCTACSSFFHSEASCPKKQAPAYQPVENTKVKIDHVKTEYQIREIFADGIPGDGTHCEKHHRMGLQIIQQLPIDQQPIPVIPDAFNGVFVISRTLLPMCTECVVATAGHETLPEGLDLCNCATRIAQAGCPSCVISQINGSMKYASIKRLQKTADWTDVVACKCGKPVGEAVVRQCVYCKGVATAPFKNYGGQALAYRADVAGSNAYVDETQLATTKSERAA